MTAAEGEARHNPPVRCVRHRLGARVPAGAVPALVDALLGRHGVAASVLHHGGLWCEGRAWDAADLPAGAALSIYAFEREPEPVALPAPLPLWESPAAGLVAVDKPAYLPIQGTRASRRFSLEAALRRALCAPALVAAHRLDRETSGLVLFGRDGAAAAAVHAALRGGRFEKAYLAVVRPAPTFVEAVVRGAMCRAPHPAGASHSYFTLLPEGAPAPPDAAHSETHLRVLRRAGDRALLLARPITGRTHQIRVHLASLGTPIEGDTLYGMGRSPGAPRLQLHAFAVRFRPSGESALRTLLAPPPAELALTADWAVDGTEIFGPRG